jgi:hypothetical protein
MSEPSGPAPANPGSRAQAPEPSRKKTAISRWAPTAWPKLIRNPAWLLGVIGLALLISSGIRVIVTSNGSGLVTIIVAGAVLLVSPFIINRVERLSVSTSGLDLQLARDVADLGAPKAAQILDRTDLARFAESYAFVHKELEGQQYYNAKIHLQDLLVTHAAALSSSEKFDPTEVRTLFANAAPTMRVLVLGLMQGDISLADSRTTRAAIENPETANEQYQGLVLAMLCWRRLPGPDRAAIKHAIRNDPDIQAGEARGQIANEILSLPDSPDGAWTATGPEAGWR